MNSNDPIAYPSELNPFGSGDEDTEPDNVAPTNERSAEQVRGASEDDYPIELSPFGDDEPANGDDVEARNSTCITSEVADDDYDESLNPFCDDNNGEGFAPEQHSSQEKPTINIVSNEENYANPFEENETDQEDTEKKSTDQVPTDVGSSEQPHQSLPNILDKPPIPLPRTKSLLKKEQLRKQEKTASSPGTTPPPPPHPPASLPRVLSSGNVPKKKRIAPPVPINFKRQVSGSPEEYEKELNEISGELTSIEKRASEANEVLESNQQPSLNELEDIKCVYIEFVKRREALVRRQKELMYRKRELALNQIHSDIEYELRMIGNKQKSNRTVEDQAREEELLKRLIEIVEEKSDIVEHLNKVYASDNNDLEQALNKLNLSKTQNKNDEETKGNNTNDSLKVSENCDKGKQLSRKFTKFATLLPKGSTLKNPIKIKRKHLFKKQNSGQMDRTATSCYETRS